MACAQRARFYRTLAIHFPLHRGDIRRCRATDDSGIVCEACAGFRDRNRVGISPVGRSLIRIRPFPGLPRDGSTASCSPGMILNKHAYGHTTGTPATRQEPPSTGQNPPEKQTGQTTTMGSHCRGRAAGSEKGEIRWTKAEKLLPTAALDLSAPRYTPLVSFPATPATDEYALSEYTVLCHDLSTLDSRGSTRMMKRGQNTGTTRSLLGLMDGNLGQIDRQRIYRVIRKGIERFRTRTDTREHGVAELAFVGRLFVLRGCCWRLQGGRLCIEDFMRSRTGSHYELEQVDNRFF